MYSLLSRYYDLENAEFTEDLEFWIELAEEHGGPVLELGCGTGRVLLQIARRGLAITGVDNSPEMLARLEEKLRATSALGKGGWPAAPTLINADIQSFSHNTQYAIALLPFNTFMHLLTLEAQVAALTNIRKHLAAGAPLVLDVVNPVQAYAAEEQGLTLERSFADGERTVQQFSQMRLERAAQLAHITWLYDSVGPGGDVQRLTVPLTLRYTFPAEMRLLLEKCGLTLTHLWGDYDRAPFSDDAPRMIVMATAS
ncbi:MAG: class I SAM-dependent methyltransferase [Anaerolineales bacterium]|nr:class I SAM-dependent methyltransferase [Anaerolineales bacterium]